MPSATTAKSSRPNLGRLAWAVGLDFQRKNTPSHECSLGRKGVVLRRAFPQTSEVAITWGSLCITDRSCSRARSPSCSLSRSPSYGRPRGHGHRRPRGRGRRRTVVLAVAVAVVLAVVLADATASLQPAS